MNEASRVRLTLRFEAAEHALALARRELAAVRLARTESPGDDEHDPEGSTLSSDWSRMVGMTSAAEAHLTSVTRAVDRLLAQTYGTCLRCGLAIAPARLEAIPEAELCIECANIP